MLPDIILNKQFVKNTAFLLLLIFLYFCSCAHIKEFNRPVDVHDTELEEIHFKRAKFSVSGDEGITKVKNAVMNKKLGNLNYKRKKNVVSHDISEIASLQYSNTNLGAPLGLMGWVAGICYALRDNGNNGNSVGLGSPASLFYPALSSLAGFTIGNLIGRYIYINWQEYDLGAFKQNSATGMYPRRNRYAVLKLKIPFR